VNEKKTTDKKTKATPTQPTIQPSIHI